MNSMRADVSPPRRVATDQPIRSHSPMLPPTRDCRNRHPGFLEQDNGLFTEGLSHTTTLSERGGGTGQIRWAGKQGPPSSSRVPMEVRGCHGYASSPALLSKGALHTSWGSKGWKPRRLRRGLRPTKLLTIAGVRISSLFPMIA